MVKNHIKRIAAPKTWRVLRKTTVFITNPKPGAHKIDFAVSLNTFLKEMVLLTKTLKETKYLLTNHEVLINGKRKRDHKNQTGLLDVVSVPHAQKNYRIIMDSKGKLASKEISEAESKNLLLKIIGKTLLKQGKVQVGTMQGRTVLVDKKEAATYKVGDSVLYDLATKKIKAHFQMQKGALAIIYTGKHAGKIGTMEDMSKDTVKIKTKKETFETNKEYILVIGKDKSAIELD